MLGNAMAQKVYCRKTWNNIFLFKVIRYIEMSRRVELFETHLTDDARLMTVFAYSVRHRMASF